MGTMPGYARITLEKSFIWVRFESVGRKERFNLLLRAFHSSFPLAVWDEQMKGWQLSRSKLSEVIKFCDRVFGPQHIRFQNYDTIVRSARQLALKIDAVPANN